MVSVAAGKIRHAVYPVSNYSKGSISRSLRLLGFLHTISDRLVGRPEIVCGFWWDARVLQIEPFQGLGMIWGKCNELRPQARSKEEVGVCHGPPGKVS